MPRYALFKDGRRVISGELRTVRDAWRFAFQFDAVAYSTTRAALKPEYSIKEIPEVDNE